MCVEYVTTKIPVKPLSRQTRANPDDSRGVLVTSNSLSLNQRSKKEGTVDIWRPKTTNSFVWKKFPCNPFAWKTLGVTHLL
jgi:hypothetical protein